MLYSSLDYAGALSLLGIVPLVLGLPLYFLGRTPGNASSETAKHY
jgi:hypothetical protein